ncbi:SDR family NAD(P)-dependent oxidoreductase [Legionella sp. CNM-4043-24]|uniref:SDR family NAD(P)-dependent oxidoreductase n=1 Tax=Legionella sp. CNM-4043-24 TaxID=3421646 RepID=UPI00403ABCDC
MFVVTGGGSGIGRALAQALAQLGRPVMIVGRRREALVETAADFPLISVCQADVSTAEGRQHLQNELSQVERLDALIHNAGMIEPIMPIGAIPEEAWRQTMEVNLNAPLFLNQALADKLTQGRVLHMGSAVAHFPVSGWAAYCVSKAALHMLTRCSQLESRQTAYASVMPGIIDTDMQALIRNSEGMDPEQVLFYKNLKKDNRLLSPDTVASFLCWLLLDVEREVYVEREWDIYETFHHASWLRAPHRVPHWE